MEVWYNPSCSKSRTAAAELEKAGITPAIRRYLDQPPTADELGAMLDALGLQPWEVARTGESVAAEAGIADLPRTAQARDQWIEAMVAHPILIQRPLLRSADGTAYVGRDAGGIAAAIAHEAIAHDRPAG